MYYSFFSLFLFSSFLSLFSLSTSASVTSLANSYWIKHIPLSNLGYPSFGLFAIICNSSIGKYILSSNLLNSLKLTILSSGFSGLLSFFFSPFTIITILSFITLCVTLHSAFPGISILISKVLSAALK